MKNLVAADGDVTLRELMDSDLPAMVMLADNKKVAKNLRDGFPNPYTMEDAIKFKAFVDSLDPQTIFAIEYKGEYCGNISLMPGTDVYRKSAEIGYFLGEKFWNKGIMTRATKLIVEWGFANLDIVRIHTGVFAYNEASQKVLEKCGFVKEGIFRKSICKYGEMYDEVRYAILRT